MICTNDLLQKVRLSPDMKCAHEQLILLAMAHFFQSFVSCHIERQG
jgi:hypothetical protein